MKKYFSEAEVEVTLISAFDVILNSPSTSAGGLVTSSETDSDLGKWDEDL